MLKVYEKSNTMKRIKTRKYSYYAADFETTANPDGPVVYAWAIKNIKKEKITVGLQIMEFLTFLDTFENDSTIFFHNGAKFDFLFILKAIKEFNAINSDYYAYYNNAEDDVDPSYRMISTTQSSKTKVFSFTITNIKGIEITFRDTNLQFAAPLSSYGKQLNQAYNTDKYSKLDLDGGYTRATLYKDLNEFMNDGNQLEYLKQDVIILSEFINLMDKTIPVKDWQMTAAGTAGKEYAKILGKKVFERYNQAGIKFKGIAVYKDESGKVTSFKKGGRFLKPAEAYEKVFAYDRYNLGLSLFDVKHLQEEFMNSGLAMDTVLRKFLKGGLTMGNGKYANRVVKNALYVDVVSMYPSIEVDENNLFPFGRAVYDKPEGDHVTLYELNIIENCINEKGMPFIGVGAKEYYKNDKTIKKSNLTDAKIYNKILKPGKYYITDVELEQFIKYYKGKYTYNVVCYYNALPGSWLNKDYIMKWYKIKSNAKTPGEKTGAKLFLNSQWGKTAQKPVRNDLKWVGSKTEDGWSKVVTVNQKSDEVILKEIQNNKSLQYLPFGIWTTAHARMKLVKATGDRFDLIIGCDTDSLIVKAPNKEIASDPFKAKEWIESVFDITVSKKLGDWEPEQFIKTIAYRRAKQYMFETFDNKKHIKMAGFYFNPEQVKNTTFDGFIKGGYLIEQTLSKVIKGGVYIYKDFKKVKNAFEYVFSDTYTDAGLKSLILGSTFAIESLKFEKPDK